MFSGIAVPMTATAGIVALIRRGWKALLLTVGPVAAVYIVWLATVGSAGLESDADMFRLPLYVGYGIRGTLDGIAVTELTMPLLIPIVLLLGTVGSIRRRTRPAAAVACGVGSVLIFAVTGIGRISEFGVEYAGSSRYVYLAAALLLPLVGLGLTLIARTGSLARIAVLLFLLVGIVTNFRLLYGVFEREARRDQLVRQTLLAAAVPSAFRGPLLGDRPEPQFAGALQLQDLFSLRVDGALPEIRTISAEARLQAAANLQVSFSVEPRLASEDRSAALVAGAASTEGGCVSIDPRTSFQRPTAVVSVSEPTSLGIRSDVAGEIEVLIRRDGTVTRLPRTFGLPEGRTSFLNLGVVGSEAIVRLPPAGQTTLCNLRLP
jgi:hypothetical protein